MAQATLQCTGGKDLARDDARWLHWDTPLQRGSRREFCPLCWINWLSKGWSCSLGFITYPPLNLGRRLTFISAQSTVFAQHRTIVSVLERCLVFREVLPDASLSEAIVILLLLSTYSSSPRLLPNLDSITATTWYCYSARDAKTLRNRTRTARRSCNYFLLSKQ